MVAVDKLIRPGPPKHAADILQVIKEEQTKLKASVAHSRPVLNLMICMGQDAGGPLTGFFGKRRVIDNGRKTGHNLHTYPDV